MHFFENCPFQHSLEQRNTPIEHRMLFGWIWRRLRASPKSSELKSADTQALLSDEEPPAYAVELNVGVQGANPGESCSRTLRKNEICTAFKTLSAIKETFTVDMGRVSYNVELASNTKAAYAKQAMAIMRLSKLLMHSPSESLAEDEVVAIVDMLLMQQETILAQNIVARFDACTRSITFVPFQTFEMDAEHIREVMIPYQSVAMQARRGRIAEYLAELTAVKRDNERVRVIALIRSELCALFGVSKWINPETVTRMAYELSLVPRNANVALHVPEVDAPMHACCVVPACATSPKC